MAAPDPACKPGVDIDFGKPGDSALSASICGFNFTIPSFPFPPAFNFAFNFPPPLPIPKLGFALTCDPKNPIDITAGLEWGGGRISCQDANPDDVEAS